MLARKIKIFVWLAVAAGLIILGVLTALSETKLGRINKMNVSGNNYVSSQEIEQSAKELIKKPLIKPFAGNFFVFSKTRVALGLKKDFPRLSRVDIKRALFHKNINIKVEERSPEGIYCGALETTRPDTETNAAKINNAKTNYSLKDCFLIDKEGILFAQAPQTEGALILVLLDTSGRTLQLGEQAVTPEIVGKTLNLWQEFHSQVNTAIKQIIINQNTIKVQTLEGWEADFDASGDLNQQLNALRELLAKTLPKDKRSEISVIDLRVPNRIYYR